MGEDRDAAFVLDPLDQRLAAARHNHIDIFGHAQQRAHRLTVGGRRRLYRGGGRARFPQPVLQAGQDYTGGFEALGAPAQNRGVARLYAEAAGVGGDIGAGFVDHADDAQRYTHTRDFQAVGALPLGQHGADGVRQGCDLFQTARHGLDPLVVQHETVQERALHAVGLSTGDILGIGGQNLVLAGTDRRRRAVQGCVLGLR